jgi:hypothetical protein
MIRRDREAVRARWRIFARLVGSGMSQAKAYLEAGYSDSRSASSTRAKASQLAREPMVALWIAEYTQAREAAMMEARARLVDANPLAMPRMGRAHTGATNRHALATGWGPQSPGEIGSQGWGGRPSFEREGAKDAVGGPQLYPHQQNPEEMPRGKNSTSGGPGREVPQSREAALEREMRKGGRRGVAGLKLGGLTMEEAAAVAANADLQAQASESLTVAAEFDLLRAYDHFLAAALDRLARTVPVVPIETGQQMAQLLEALVSISGDRRTEIAARLSGMSALPGAPGEGMDGGAVERELRLAQGLLVEHRHVAAAGAEGDDRVVAGRVAGREQGGDAGVLPDEAVAGGERPVFPAGEVVASA